MESTVKKTQPVSEESDINQTETGNRKWMSVKEMGDLLGLRKTDRYWLVHKNVFETQTMYGKMWVNIPSFEKWYANQAKYRKISGEEPGLELKKWSLSPRDISELLEIPEYRVYELIKEKHWETVTVDFWTRVLRDSFLNWYQNQKHYRTKEDRLRDQELEEQTITFPKAAAMIGLTRNQFYPILRNPQYANLFEVVEIAGRRRITRESFQRFLESQDEYDVVNDPRRIPDTLKEEPIGNSDPPANCRIQKSPDYLTVAEAAKLAKMSRQAMTKYVDQGCFGRTRNRNLIRIRRETFEDWLEKRKKEAAGHGIN